jgi:hypothetical protein
VSLNTLVFVCFKPSGPHKVKNEVKRKRPAQPGEDCLGCGAGRVCSPTW